MMHPNTRGSSPVAVLGVTLLTGMLAACSDDCPTLEACDIRTESCQRRTARVAACLRGGEPSSPLVEVVDKEAFVDGQVQAAEQDPPSPNQRAVGQGLSLVNLMPSGPGGSEGNIRDFWDTVGAFYSSTTGRVTIFDSGRSLDEPGAVILLLHEFIHAMQHEELGDSYREDHSRTYDEELALDGIIEGEATLYQDLALVFGYGSEPDDFDWGKVFRFYQLRNWLAARKDGARFELAEMRFSYAYGGDYVNRAWRSGGNGAVRDLVANPPTSTREILAGYGAERRDGSSWREDPNEVGSPVMSAEFEAVATLHLGAWLFAVFEEDRTAGSALSFSDTGFMGDVFSVFRKPANGDVTIVWRLRFERPEQAEGLIERTLGDGSLVMVRQGRDVIVVASTDEVVPRAIAGTLRFGPSAESDSVGLAVPAARPSGTRVCVQLPR